MSDPADGRPPSLLLAQRWKDGTDITGWWMSEKLDGVRAYWDGQYFISRLGNRYLAPDWFVAGLPDEPLDGELWAGRTQFQRTVSIVRRYDAGSEWQDIRFLVFDAPQHEGRFESRIDHVSNYFSTYHAPYADVVIHYQCEGPEHLRRELERVEALGGEGLMVREPGSLYHAGRSRTLLKIKTFHDAEAKVLDHLPGTGKHEGRLGALRVVTPGGIEFSVGTGLSDAQRDNPPPVGAIITYRYQELSNTGVPRFPSYVGQRHDFAWAEAVARAQHEATGAGDESDVPQQDMATLIATTHIGLTSPAPPGNTPPPRSHTPRQPAPPPEPEQPSEEFTDGVPRRFEFELGASRKFWEITVNESGHTVRYGRVGREARARHTAFTSPREARVDASRQIIAKRNKGYVETNPETPVTPDSG